MILASIVLGGLYLLAGGMYALFSDVDFSKSAVELVATALIWPVLIVRGLLLGILWVGRHAEVIGREAVRQVRL